MGFESRQYFETIDVGLVTEAELPAPPIDQPYFAAVSAYDGVGQESPYSEEIRVYAIDPAFNIPAGEGRLVTAEAESGTLVPPMTTGSSGGVTWVEPATSSGEGSVTIPFGVDLTGSYTIWARVKAPAVGSDSFFYSVDGIAESVFYAYGSKQPDPASVSSEWVWACIKEPDGPARRFLLTPGTHTITFRTRSADILLDRLVISSRQDFVPSDGQVYADDFVAIVQHPQDRTVHVGKTVSFRVETISTGPVDYQWLKDGSPLAGGGISSLVISSADEGDAGTYSAFVISGSSLQSTEAATLEVTIPPLAISSLSIQAGGSLRFTVTGGVGAEVSVYASSDLENWALIGTQTNVDGQITANDPGAEGQSRRFYRLQTP